MPVEAFEDKWTPEPNTGCHLWIRGLSTNGYGQYWNGITNVRAHRHAYQMAYGWIPRELVMDHLCREKTCVNPEHLEVVTQRENLRRGKNTFVSNPGSRRHLRG